MMKAIKQGLGRLFNSVSGVTTPEQWLVDYVNSGNESSTGQRVSFMSAIGLPSVWSGVNIISGHMAQMPVQIRRKLPDGGHEVITNHPAHKILNKSPNDLQSAQTFREVLTTHALLHGNGRAFIDRNGLGQPTRLILMNPNATWTHMLDGEKFHNVTFEWGVIAEDDPVWNYHSSRRPGQPGAMFTIPDEDVFHLPGLGYNGYWGLDLLSVAKNVFGLDQAGLDAAGYVFRNSGQPNLVLEAPIGTFPTHKEAEEFLTWFRKAHSGLSNQAKTALLREGITARTLPIDAADAQFLESRNFSRDDIALLLGVEYLMGESAAVYKDLAERQSAYVTNTLSRWIARFEDEVVRKLFTPQQRDGDSLCVRMDASILMRGSPNTLADYTGKLRSQEMITGNEVREMHGLNPIPGLDDVAPPEPEPAPEPANDPGESENDDDALNTVVRSVFASVIEYEAGRVTRAASQKGNFISWVAKFYEDTHAKTINQKCEDCRIDPAVGADYCQSRQNELLEIAGVVTQDQLPAAIKELTAKWPKDAEDFTRCLT